MSQYSKLLIEECEALQPDIKYNKAFIEMFN